MRIPRLAFALAAVACTAHCTAAVPPEEDVSTRSSAVTCSVEWNATWAQGSGANNWWVEYAISGGAVASAYLEVVGRGNVTLTSQWGKWTGPTSARIDAGASVIVHAVDTA
jgi:hypothetical protein